MLHKLADFYVGILFILELLYYTRLDRISIISAIKPLKLAVLDS